MYSSTIMPKCYCYSCGGWAVPCHTTSPQRGIPPLIKRARILVRGGVVILISIKLYEIISRLWAGRPRRKIVRHSPTRGKKCLQNRLPSKLVRRLLAPSTRSDLAQYHVTYRCQRSMHTAVDWQDQMEMLYINLHNPIYRCH